MATTELRPLSLGALLDRTFSYYRTHFWLFVGIMAVPQALLLILMTGMFWAVSLLATPGPPNSVRFVFNFIWYFPLGLSVVVFCVYPTAYAATTFALSEVHLERTITIRAAYRKALGKLGRVAKLGMAVLVRMLGWLITVILPLVAILLVFRLGLAVLVRMLWLIALILSPIAILLLFWYGFAVPVLLLENISAGQALKRSRFLSRGQLGRIFLSGLLAAVVFVALALMIQVPIVVATGLIPRDLDLFWFGTLTWAGYLLVGALTAPLLMIALVLLYYDVRVRKEGFDLQLMLAGTSVIPPPAARPKAAPPVAS